MPKLNAEDYELFHYGIKGMKWGIRRKDSNGDGLVDAAKSKLKKDAKEALKRPVSDDAKGAGSKRSTVKKHGTDALSNKDLKQLVERMNLEQQYANLVEQGKSQSVRSSGRRYVADILKDVGKDLAAEALKTGVRRAAGAAANRAAGQYSSWEKPSAGPAAITMIRKAITS